MIAVGWQFISLSDCVAVPWCNGGGLTRELLAWPHAQSWQWRISVAEVRSDGPFSRFDGVQRSLAILHGAGLRLQFVDRTVELAQGSEPLIFSGTDAVHCTLIDGPVRDLNLMVNGRSARMTRLCGMADRRIARRGVVALYAADGPSIMRTADTRLVVPPDTLAWCALAEPCAISIEGARAFWMEIGDEATAEASTA